MSSPANSNMPFRFLDELVLRTPAVPFIHLPDEQQINNLLKEAGFMEAVYLASPVLYAECVRLKDGQITDAKEINKIRISLIKYYQRMYSRCTPFGLFSGCTLVQWGNDADGIVIPGNSFLRSTRLDMHYLCASGQQLSSLSSIKQRLHYFPNNSVYRIGEEVRYIEYKYQSGRRFHQISSVVYSDYLDAVLRKATTGATIGEIKDLLIQQESVTEEEALEFIDELINSQVLVNEMDPAITGDEFTQQLLAVLKKINTPEDAEISVTIERLEDIVDKLKKADEKFHNSPEVYHALIEKIKEFGVSFEESKLFQVDMFSKPARYFIHEDKKNDLMKAIGLLSKLFSSSNNENLSSFAERFRKRYEDRLVPLLQALDAETGVGYPEQSGNNLSPLLENLVLPGNNDNDRYDIKWNKREQWLFNRLVKLGDEKEIIIREEELESFVTDFSKFPPSLSVMFSAADDEMIIFRGCSGSSAANLLGRFAHADEKINKLVQKITTLEQEQNHEVVFAEIIHLPEDRAGNILLHPAFRKYEIPFLAQSSLSSENQIMLQDILIKVNQNNSIHLFSKKTAKEIIPRLSNAHNYSFRSLPVYYFLADMQTQGLVTGLMFNWGSMARHFKYLPRVKYGKVILFEGTWQLQKNDFETLFSAGGTAKEKFSGFKKQYDLPELFVLADGDNELIVDTKSADSIEAFIAAIKGREFITLKEFFKPAKDAVKDEKGRPYNNQFIGALINDQKVYNGAGGLLQDGTVEDVKQVFLPGSEWLYYKVYCGTKTADEILLSVVLPLTEALQEQQLIDKWFFIRYNDPDFHLRLRFHISDVKNAGKVINLFYQHIEITQKAGLLWKVQADTYQRETERYGTSLIEAAEELFFTDSKMKIEFLLLTEGDEREKFRWLWALRSVDELLNSFGYSLSGKYELMQGLQQQFAAEFKADKSLFRQLNQQYNENRKQIISVLENPLSSDNDLKPLLDIIQKYKNEQNEKAQRIAHSNAVAGNQQQLNLLLGSYIHMNLNRLFLSEPRLHELIIYDLLCSYYRSIIKRKI